MKTAERLIYEGTMKATEKLERAMQADWEFVGDPWQLCHIMREEIMRLRTEVVRAHDAGWAQAAGEAQAVCEKRAESLEVVALRCEAMKCGAAVWHNLMELPIENVPVIE